MLKENEQDSINFNTTNTVKDNIFFTENLTFDN